MTHPAAFGLVAKPPTPENKRKEHQRLGNPMTTPSGSRHLLAVLNKKHMTALWLRNSGYSWGGLKAEYPIDSPKSLCDAIEEAREEVFVTHTFTSPEKLGRLFNRRDLYVIRSEPNFLEKMNINTAFSNLQTAMRLLKKVPLKTPIKPNDFVDRFINFGEGGESARLFNSSVFPEPFITATNAKPKAISGYGNKIMSFATGKFKFKEGDNVYVKKEGQEPVIMPLDLENHVVELADEVEVTDLSQYFTKYVTPSFIPQLLKNQGALKKLSVDLHLPDRFSASALFCIRGLRGSGKKVFLNQQGIRAETIPSSDNMKDMLGNQLFHHQASDFIGKFESPGGLRQQNVTHSVSLKTHIFKPHIKSREALLKKGENIAFVDIFSKPEKCIENIEARGFGPSTIEKLKQEQERWDKTEVMLLEMSLKYKNMVYILLDNTAHKFQEIMRVVNSKPVIKDRAGLEKILQLNPKMKAFMTPRTEA